MKLSEKSSGTIKYFLITLFILLIPLFYYFLYHIPSNKSYYTSRNLRLLADISGNLTKRLESYQWWLDNLTLDNNFIQNEVEKGLPAYDPDTVTWQDSLAYLKKHIIPNVTETLNNRFSKVENLIVDDFTFSYKPKAARVDTSFKPDPTWSTAYITSGEKGDLSQLRMVYYGHKRNPNYQLDSYDITLQAEINLNSVIEPLLRKDVFDNILIFENNENRRVIFQQVRDEFIAVRIDTLSSRINSMFMSGYDQVTFSNSSYKVYSHPVQIKNVVDHAHDDSSNVLNDPHSSHAPQPLNWTIVGFVDADRFNADCRTISHYKISLFLFIVLLVVISLPLIKLKFIGPLEEITRFDLVASIFGLIFGAGIITFLLITVYSNKHDEHHLDNLLERLNNQVNNNLFEELDDIYQQAHHISARFAENDSARFRAILDNPDTKGIVASCMADTLVWDFPDSTFPFFTQIAWLNPENGHQVLKIDPDHNTTPLVDVSRRDYYQKLRDNDGWTHEFEFTCDKCGSISVENQYYIQPIISLTTGERTEVITFFDRHLKNYIQAVSHNFLSLRDVVLPGTFGFCIVDDQGRALFHSDDAKSLRENFLRETDNNPLLSSALFSRTSAKMTLPYQGKEHRLYVKPIQNTDWYLITFVMLSNIHSAELSAAVLSFALFIGLLVWYVLLFFLFRFNFPSKSFSWLLPHREMETCYQLYYISLFVLSGIYFTITFLVGPTVNLILALVLPPINLLFIYFLLQFRTVCGMLTTMKTNIPRIGRYAILLLILAAGVVAFSFQKVSIAYLLFFLFITLVFLSDTIKALFEKYRMPSFYVSYVASIIAFLIMTSIVPTIGFFRLVYNDEMRLLIKNVQLQFSQSYMERADRLESKFRTIQIFDAPDSTRSDSSAAQRPALLNARLANHLDIYINSFQNSEWHTIEDSIIQKRAINWKKIEPGILSRGLAHLRNRVQIVNPYNWQLYQNQAADSSWAWTRENGIIRYNVVPSHLKPVGLSYLDSKDYPFRPPSDAQWALGMLGLIIILGLVIIYFIHKVIILDITLPERHDADAVSFHHNVIYIGPHGSGKSEAIDKIPQAYKINFRTIDDVAGFIHKINFGEKLPDNINTVILDHFDVDLDVREISALKLTLVKRLTATYKKNVVIVSSVDPISFIEKQTTSESEDWRSMWIHTLNSFTRVYHDVRSPSDKFRQTVIEYGTAQTDLDDLAIRQKNEDFCTTLIDECNHTPFLQQVGLEMMKRFDFKGLFFNKKAFYAEILQRASTYYESIWHDCTIEEKITLLNLVKNRFFVRKDSEFIRILLQKGLVIRDGRFRCFNNSFELYVRKGEAAADIREWRKKNARNWGNIRTLVISVIVAIALFIFLTQRETFNQWIALVSTFVAGIPAVLKLFSLINFKSVGSSATDGGK